MSSGGVLKRAKADKEVEEHFRKKGWVGELGWLGEGTRGVGD